MNIFDYKRLYQKSELPLFYSSPTTKIKQNRPIYPEQQKKESVSTFETAS